MSPTRSTTSATIAELLREQAEFQPDSLALIARGCAPLTYGALRAQIDQGVARLRLLGVSSSTRVAVVLPNGPTMASAFLTVAAGAVCVPLNPAYRAAEFEQYLRHTRARYLVVGAGDSAAAREAAAAAGVSVLEIRGDPSRPAGGFTIDGPPGVAAGDEPAITAQQTALILHTSGTTARPKIVPLSHANLVASARSMARHLALSPSDRCLNVMPLFHIHGLVGALLASLAGGASVICTAGFDERAFFDWVAEFDPTWYTAAPTIHQAVVAQGARYREVAARHRFRFVRSSSSSLPPSTFDALRRLTGAPVIEAYGMTEASHEMASNPLSGPWMAGSVGVPTGVEIAIMDAAGRLLTAGTTGEIVIRGPGVAAGYEDDARANAEAFVAGWFRTGDLGRLDETGYLHIAGRLKEIVNRGGEKVSPREIDEALLEHGDVLQAVAFAVPHPTLGEDIAALVVLRDGARTDEPALRHFLSTRLAAFKVPSSLLLVDVIPKGATGKVQRTGLYGQFKHLLRKNFVAPATDTERSLALIFREVLGGEPVGADDNFFAIGGDSLKGAQVMARIRATHGVELAVPALFGHPTVATLAREVEAADATARLLLGSLEAEIEGLSDEEVVRLLAQEEARAT